MSDYRIIDLDDQLVTSTARKFGITEDEVRRQYAALQEQGLESTLAEMEDQVAAIEDEINVVVDDATTRWLNASPSRLRNITDFYEEGWTGVDPEEIDEGTVSELFLRLSITIFMLAEAREQITELLDGGRRQEKNDEVDQERR